MLVVRAALAALLLSSPVFSVALSEPPAPAASPAIYDPAADAARDLAAAGKRAGARGARVLAIVGGNWCGWCRALERTLTEDASVKTALAPYEVVHVNYSKENRNEAVMESLGRPDKLGFPALVVLSPRLEVLHLQESGSLETGDPKVKGHDPAKLVAFLATHAPKR